MTGISNPSIQWRRLLKTGYVGDGAKLDLKNIQADDTGVYECSVKSDKGEEKASVSVIVQSKSSTCFLYSSSLLTLWNHFQAFASISIA